MDQRQQIVKDLTDYKTRLIKQGKYRAAFIVSMCIAIAKGD